MSAKIPVNMEIKDLLKATGYDCPEDLQGKTFNEATSGSGGGSGGSANLTTKELSAIDIRNAVENGQAITPPEGYDGFSEITFTNYLLTSQTFTTNQTKTYGTPSSPFFPKELNVNVPSDYTIDFVTVSKTSDPVTISFDGKAFVYLGIINSSGVLTGLGGAESNLRNTNSVSVSSAGSTAGTVSLDPDAKTITYTPNPSYQMGPVTLTKVIIG